MSSRNVKDLDPAFQPLVVKFLNECNKVTSPYTTFITDGFRSYEEQTTLYNQGRTAPGKIVTNAKAGESWHNFGLAIDVAFQLEGKLSYAQTYYNKIVPIGKALGFTWGGDFTALVDKPHFEWHPNITLSQARAGKRPKPNSDIMDTDMSQPWMRQMFLELGLDIDKPESEIRGRTQEVIDGYKKRDELQKRVDQLNKDLAFNAGQSAEFEERLRIVEKERDEAKSEISDIKRVITQRDTDISKLQEQVQVLTSQLDPTKVIVVTKDEYAKLTSKNGIQVYSARELLGALLKRIVRRQKGV